MYTHTSIKCLNIQQQIKKQVHENSERWEIEG